MGRSTLQHVCLLMLAMLIAAPLASQDSSPPAPEEVRDGTDADVDYLTRTDMYSVNWDGVDWSGFEGENKYYSVSLHEQPVSDDLVEVQVPLNGTTGTPPTEYTFTGLSLSHNTGYYIVVHSVVAANMSSSSEVRSDGVLVDVEEPTFGSLTPDGGVVGEQTFPVEWAFSDRSGGEEESGIASYDVEVKEGSSAWRRVYSETTRTSFDYTGSFGGRYRFRVRARDNAGNETDFYESGAVSVTEYGGALSLTAEPDAATLASDEDTLAVTLEVTLSGAASATVTSVRERRHYRSTGVTETSAADAVSTVVRSGDVLARTLTVDSLDRSRAGSEAMDARYRVSAVLPDGETVEANATVVVDFSAGLAASLSVHGVEVELPTAPYDRGDTVVGRVRVDATGAGTVEGEVLVDGSSTWSADAAFVAEVDGETVFDIAAPLPTDSSGTHSVTVDLTAPPGHSDTASYTVSTDTSPFPPDTLVLIPGVAEITNLSGTAEATTESGAGYTEYRFTGTATLHALSLDTAPIADASVEDLVVRYPGDPGPPEIRSGTVEASASDATPLAEAADGYLRIRELRFAGSSAPGSATETLQAAAVLTLPQLDLELLTHDNFPVGPEGVQGISFSHDPGDPVAFELFGARFRLHDAPAHPAIELEVDEAAGRYAISLSGSIAMEEKEGTSTSEEVLTTFSDLTFFTDGEVDGTIGFPSEHEVIPDYLYFTGITVYSTDDADAYAMDLRGYVGSLPDPLGDSGEVEFALTIATNGDAEGRVAVIDELSGDGHAFGGDDDTEWDFTLAALDLTYIDLGISITRGTINRDHSELRIAFDAYLNLDSDASAEERRVSFGTLNDAGDLQNGMRIDFDGDVTIDGPTHVEVVRNELIDLQAISIRIDSLGVNLSGTFAFVFNGSFDLDLEAVRGGITISDLSIALDGTVSGLSDAIDGGSLSIADVVGIQVDAVEWGGEGTVEIQRGTLTRPSSDGDGSSGGSGGGAADASSIRNEPDRVIDVDSYFRIVGASIYIGGSESSILQGSVERLTVFDPSDGGRRNFVLRQAHLSVNSGDVSMTVDAEYVDGTLRVAGNVSMSDQLNGKGVGVFGTDETGAPRVGVFLAVGGLNIQVGPVTVDELGGGFMVNPHPGDLALVRSIAGFDSPKVEAKIDERRPTTDPGAFAIMVLGGVYIGDETLLSGRALVTVTSNFFRLDAEVEFAEGLLAGQAKLIASWDPVFTEGAVEIDVDIASIITGNADIDFYAYGGGVWGFSGEIGLSVLGIAGVNVEVFAGTPGFFMSTELRVGVSLGILSGHLAIEGMFWYHATPDPPTYGAYTAVEVSAEFLWGLVGATVGMEGALIVHEEAVFYTVGSFKLKVLFKTVFNGSMWVAISGSDKSAGKGRNEKYEGIMDDARNMADDMQREKEELADRLREAQLEMVRLNEEQRAAAGSVLLSTSPLVGAFAEAAFEVNEVSRWDNDPLDGLPPELELIRSRMFDREWQSVRRRTLDEREEELNETIEELERRYNDVVALLEEYDEVLTQPLPSVRELSAVSNPFEGFEEAEVEGADGPTTVRSGVDFSERRAERHRGDFDGVIEDFAEYQDAFVEQAAVIDGRLQQLDEILYGADTNLSNLASDSYTAFREHGSYIRNFALFQQDLAAWADASAETIQDEYDRDDVRSALRRAARRYNRPIVGRGSEALGRWNNTRLSLINALLSTGGEEPLDLSDFGGALSESDLFVEQGLELWWEIPLAGFDEAASRARDRRDTVLEQYPDQAEQFQSVWADATAALDRVYDRKARLYDVLYEIYDQLALYGTGMIGITNGGTPTGFDRAATNGLSFRTSAVAGAVVDASVPPPEGISPDATGIVGPLSPVQLEDAEEPSSESASTFRSAPGAPAGVRPARGRRARLVVPEPLATLAQLGPASPDMTTGASQAFSSIGLGPASELALPEAAEVNRSIPSPIEEAEVPLLPEPPATASRFVSVRRYFQGKRAETYAYLNAPNIGIVTGEAGFTSIPAVRLSAEVSAEHEIGTVEYAYRISLPVEELAAFGTDVTLPWYSMGSSNVVYQVLFKQTLLRLAEGRAADYLSLEAGEEVDVVLAVRARAAGGRAIVRRTEFSVAFDPDSGTGSGSEIRDVDRTPPTEPVVTVDPYATRADLVYASWEAKDYESGVQNYQWGVSRYDPAAEDPPEGIDWSEQLLRTEANIRGLSLEHGERYVVWVWAINGVGRTSVGRSDPFLVDTTPPEGLSLTSARQADVNGHANSLRYEFAPASDPETEIARHEVAVDGPDDDGTLVDWREVGGDRGYVVDLPAGEDSPVRVLVRALNQAGEASVRTTTTTMSYSDGTPPTDPNPRLNVTAPGSETLVLRWGRGSDPESGVLRYEYGLGTSPDEANLTGFSREEWSPPTYLIGDAPEAEAGDGGVPGFDPPDPPAGHGGEVEFGDVALTHGVDYYGLVRVTNGAGLTRVYASEPFTHDTTPPQVVSLTVPAVVESTQNIPFDFSAADPESGLAGFSFVVADLGWTSSAPEPGELGDPFDSEETEIVHTSTGRSLGVHQPAEVERHVDAALERGVLLGGRRYALRVVVYNARLVPAESEIVYFETRARGFLDWWQSLFGGGL